MLPFLRQLNLKHYKQPFFYKFILRVLFYQLLLVVLFISAFLSYFYLNRQYQSSLENRNIKQVVISNFEQYHEMIKLIETKLGNLGKKGHDFKDILDVKKYNKLLGLHAHYVKIDDAYIITSDKSNIAANRVVTGQYGKESFTILPPKEFFDSFKGNNFNKNSSTKVYINNDTLYLVKDIKTSFIALKLDLEEFVRVTTQSLGLTGKFTLNASEEVDSTTFLYNLEYQYTKPNFWYFESVQDIFKALPTSKLFFVILFLCSSLIWVLFCRAAFKQYSNNVYLDRLGAKRYIKHLTKEIKLLQEYKTGLEISYDANREFLNNLFSFCQISDEDSDFNNAQVSLSQIITDCKYIIYKDLYKNKVECEIKISSDKSVELDTAVILYILLINFLYRALGRTPKNGKIIVKLYKNENQTLVRVEDSGFDLTLHQKKEIIDNLFALSDVDLEDIASGIGIEIIKQYATHHKFVDLVIADKDLDSKDKRNHGNIIEFKKNI